MLDLLRVLTGVLAGVSFLVLTLLYLRAARRYGEYIKEKYPREAARLRKQVWSDSALWLGMLPVTTMWDLEFRFNDDQLSHLRRRIIYIFAWGVPAVWALVAISFLLSRLGGSPATP